MKTRKLLSILLSIALILSIFSPGVVTAEDDITTEETVEEPINLSLLDFLAGNATETDLYDPLDPTTVPAIIGYQEALHKSHVLRLYEDEGTDLYKIVFQNVDGSKTVYTFDFPVKYIDESGNIRDITLEIADSDSNLGEFETADNAATTTFSANFVDGISLSANETAIQLVPILPPVNSGTATMSTSDMSNAVSTAQRLDENTIEYYYDTNTTVEYSLTYTGFKEDIVVTEYTGQTSYPFRLYTNGLGLEKINDSYFLVDDNGNIQATIGDIIIFTADEKNNAFGEIIPFTIVENQEYLLNIVIDADYLSDPNTTYPIRIDPTIEINYDNSGAAAIEDITISTNTNFSGSYGSLYVGRRSTEGIARILMRFPGLDLTGMEGATITNATVTLRDLMCEGAELDVSCHVFTGAWNASSATWSNVNPNSYVSTPLSTVTLSWDIGNEFTSQHWYPFDITSAVQGWIDGNYSQDRGILFKVSSTIENGSTIKNRTFAAYNRASYKPILSVTYAPAGSQILPNDTYYLNNQNTGKYLHRTSTGTVSGQSGLLSSLGSLIQWELQKVSNGYVIRSTSSPTKYLAGATSTTSSSVSVISVSNSALPERCIWSITHAYGGGCLIKNVFSSRYLCSAGTTLYTVVGTGNVETTTYDMRVWRAVPTWYYGSTSTHEIREMSANTSFSDIETEQGDEHLLTINHYNVKELWTEPTDFTYSISSTPIISINGNTVTAHERGVTNVTAVHKVTGYTKTFEVYVKNSYLAYDDYVDMWYDFFKKFGNEYANSAVYNYHTVGDVIDQIYLHDDDITDFCNLYRIPKEFVQTVLFREIWCYSILDDTKDAAVQAYYDYLRHITGELIEDALDDSSTGLGQIFARTAIDALNNASDRGLISLERHYNDKHWGDMWTVWNNLHTNVSYNINCCALVILDCQYEFDDVCPYEDFFSFNETQIKKILSRYNGTGDAATQYGNTCYDYFLIFKSYNEVY